MVSYPVHTIESAPEGSKPALEQLQQAFGFVPNLVGAISNSPILIPRSSDCFKRFTAVASQRLKFKPCF
jgi:hypothetical protein